MLIALSCGHWVYRVDDNSKVEPRIRCSHCGQVADVVFVYRGPDEIGKRQGRVGPREFKSGRLATNGQP
jgi:hypothetical protein